MKNPHAIISFSALRSAMELITLGSIHRPEMLGIRLDVETNRMVCTNGHAMIVEETDLSMFSEPVTLNPFTLDNPFKNKNYDAETSETVQARISKENDNEFRVELINQHGEIISTVITEPLVNVAKYPDLSKAITPSSDEQVETFSLSSFDLEYMTIARKTFNETPDGPSISFHKDGELAKIKDGPVTMIIMARRKVQ